MNNKSKKPLGPAKGKILRVKHGYNPNSSSMGSIVFALPAALLAIAAGFGVVSGIITAAFLKTKNNSKKDSISENNKETTEEKGNIQ